MKVIAFIFSIPTIVGMAIWSFGYLINPSPEKVSQAGQLIAQAAVPWWIPVIQFLAPLGIGGAILILVLLYFVAKGGVG